MNARCRQAVGLTLTETVTVVAIMTVLIGLAIPSIKAINTSFQSTGAKNMISAALACARATAAEQQRYAGVRFQFGPDGHQYIIPIIQDPNILAYGFRAIEGRKPIKLPQNQGVMDLRIRTKNDAQYPGDEGIDGDDDIKPEVDGTETNLTDTTTFSIIFSPTGKLVIHEVRVRNKDGYRDTASDTRISNDDIFNKKLQVQASVAMFYQDDYTALGLGAEYSRSSFIIYDKTAFDLREGQPYPKVDPARRWSEYLSRQRPVCINPYTGTIIE
jgi:hypothetical protein